MHEFRNVEEEAVVGSSNKAFGLVLCGFFALLGLVPLAHGGTCRFWALGCSAAFGILALTFSELLKWPNKIWTQFGLLLHRVMTPMIMGIVFFVVVTPIGLIMRVSGRGSYRRKSSTSTSYWIECKVAPEAQSFKQQF